MNQILTGNQLTRLLAVPLIGYVAQLVSTGITYTSLEGDVFGDCDGTLVSPTTAGPWRNEQGELIPAGSPAGNDVIGLNRSGAEDTREEPWRLIVYKTVPCAFEGSTEDDERHVTVPRAVTQELKKKLQINEESVSLPMEAIPEDEAAPNPKEVVHSFSQKNE